RLFQVDMVKCSPNATLGGAVLEEIIRGVETMRRFATRPHSDDLTRFRDAFVARYEEQEIALTEALDGEVGIGFPPASAALSDGGPLVKGIAFPEDAEERTHWGEWESFLLGRLSEATARGDTEIVLVESDLERFVRKDPAPLPGAFAVSVAVAAAAGGGPGHGGVRGFWSGS